VVAQVSGGGLGALTPKLLTLALSVLTSALPGQAASGSSVVKIGGMIGASGAGSREGSQARAACLGQFVRLVLLAPGATEALTPDIKVSEWWRWNCG
jgi:hypothetical protein